MSEKAITLRADLVDRLHALAQLQGRSVDDVLDHLLPEQPPQDDANWALALAEEMETADIDWTEQPDLSANSARNYAAHVQAEWERRQSEVADDE